MFLQVGYGSADGRYGNPRHLVKVGHAAGPPFMAAKDDLIHDAQLIERTAATVIGRQVAKHIPIELNNDSSCYFVWLINHILLSVLRNSR